MHSDLSLTSGLFTNPFADPLFLPTLALWGGLLAIAFAGLFLATRKHTERLVDEVLYLRWRTWVTIAPVFLTCILGGSLPRLVLIIGLTLQGLREYSHIVGLPDAYRRILYGMGIIVAPVAAISLDGFYLLAPLLLITSTLQPLLLGKESHGVRHMAFAAFGWGYLAWFLGHAVLIQRHLIGGPGIILCLGLAVAMSDVFAFIVGNAFGRHKLSPRLSPNKTIEGVAGNFLGAYAGVAIMAYALPDSLRMGAMIGLPILVALGSLWGDLVESALKREFGVKDAGTWLPGFGGLLDRMDSLLIVLPLTYYALRLAGYAA